MHNHLTYPLIVTPYNEKFVESIRQEAEKLYDEEIKALFYHNFELFEETGSRPEYEEEYKEAVSA